jgi:hypothetical protein
MTTRQTFWLNVALFLGLAIISIVTIRCIIFLWPSAAGDPCTEFCGMEINMEKRYFLLVALGGVLGSFIHIATSYVDFLGNKKMVYSWVPWYLMRPFIGASLALIFYMLLRGGIVSTQAISTSKEKPLVQKEQAEQTAAKPPASCRNCDSLKADSIQKAQLQPTVKPNPPGQKPQDSREEPEPALPFNPFGIMAIACLTGLFSKQATDKLQEVFESMFNIREANKRSDPLNGNQDLRGNGQNNGPVT